MGRWRELLPVDRRRERAKRQQWQWQWHNANGHGPVGRRGGPFGRNTRHRAFNQHAQKGPRQGAKGACPVGDWGAIAPAHCTDLERGIVTAEDSRPMGVGTA